MTKATVGFVFVACMALSMEAWAESPDLKHAGPLAFAPEGVLLVGDSAGSAVFAFKTGDVTGDPGKASYNVPSLGAKVAAALGTKPSDILINDMAVNPASGNIYRPSSSSTSRARCRRQTLPP